MIPVIGVRMYPANTVACDSDDSWRWRIVVARENVVEHPSRVTTATLYLQFLCCGELSG